MFHGLQREEPSQQGQRVRFVSGGSGEGEGEMAVGKTGVTEAAPDQQQQQQQQQLTCRMRHYILSCR